MKEMLIFVWFAIFALIGALIVFIISKIFKNKFIKYIPVLLSLCLTCYALFGMLTTEAEGFKDLAYLLTMMLFGSSFIGGLATGLYIDKRKKGLN